MARRTPRPPYCGSPSSTAFSSSRRSGSRRLTGWDSRSCTHRQNIDRMITRALAIVLTLGLLFAGPAAQAVDAAFSRWLEQLWPAAQQLGVSRATFDAATRGLEPDLTLPDLVIPGRPDRQPAQAEFVQTPADYLKESSFDRLATQGRAKLEQHRATLTQIEQRFGVP